LSKWGNIVEVFNLIGWMVDEKKKKDVDKRKARMFWRGVWERLGKEIKGN